jgi:hypothetical protein
MTDESVTEKGRIDFPELLLTTMVPLLMLQQNILQMIMKQRHLSLTVISKELTYNTAIIVQ